jgi:hypothetical protein
MSIDGEMMQLTLSEWISIDDWLPKIAEDVIVFSDDKFQIDIGFRMNGKWFSDRGELPTVTHWMPLPNPPTEI